ncbi:MAG: NAD(P)-binding protein, partial [Gemmatimonadaceae bacterium]|nr:NAD(P)-binding protein [Gemmatimonadaceae bacterium]
MSDSGAGSRPGDDRLGMNAPITRRDFINGAIVAGAGLALGAHTAAALPVMPDTDPFTGPGGIGDYAASNGNTYDVMRAAHAMRDGAFDDAIAGATDTGEVYDLIAVGGGISGLAAAVFFQKQKGGKVLVLDNHPIFGGEAKRNELLVNGRRIVAHQGSAIFPVVRKGSYTANFYDMIGMDRYALDYQRWRGPSPAMELGNSPYDQPKDYGFYFTPAFTGGKGSWLLDPWGKQLAGAPLGDDAKAELLRWRSVDDAGPRPKTEGDAISRKLDAMTLEDYLIARHHISRETVRRFLSPVEGGGYGLGPDALSAYCAWAIETEFPEDGDAALGDQMFPDGNTTFARLMVKTLVPDAFTGPRTIDAVTTSRLRTA